MGLTEEELPDIVSRWREANKRIRDLWYSMDNAAVQVITQGGSVGINGLLLAVSMTTTRAPTVSPFSSPLAASSTM